MEIYESQLYYKMFKMYMFRKFTVKLTSNSFSTRRPLGPKPGSGGGIACCVNSKRGPDILKCSQLDVLCQNIQMFPIGCAVSILNHPPPSKFSSTCPKLPIFQGLL